MNTDQYYLDLCLELAEYSNDPSTKVGSVIVRPDGRRVAGFNQFPRRIENTLGRWNDSVLKNKIVVHAEINALLKALHASFPLKNCTLYVWAKDVQTGVTWGGPPCTRCAVELIQAGIGEIRVPTPKSVPERWIASLNLARELILEAGVKYTELE